MSVTGEGGQVCLIFVKFTLILEVGQVEHEERAQCSVSSCSLSISSVKYRRGGFFILCTHGQPGPPSSASSEGTANSEETEGQPKQGGAGAVPQLETWHFLLLWTENSFWWQSLTRLSGTWKTHFPHGTTSPGPPHLSWNGYISFLGPTTIGKIGRFNKEVSNQVKYETWSHCPKFSVGTLLILLIRILCLSSNLFWHL